MSVTPDLEALRRDLRALAPADSAEIDRLVAAAVGFADISPGIDRPPELASLHDQLHALWGMRDQVGTLVHFRGSVGDWTHDRITSRVLRDVLTNLMPTDTPMLFTLMLLGYLQRGWLSRPVGGTARFRDALVERYFALGGQVRLDTTVEEILVHNDAAHGVRLTDGTMLSADLVVSTSSAPETVLRLLGGRYGAEAVRDRLARWKLFDPLVIASFGVPRALADVPASLLVTELPASELAGRSIERVHARVYNDDPSFAPPGHTVVQLLLPSDYDWWATRGSSYGAAKADLAVRVRALLAPHIPGLGSDECMIDVATPLTFWRSARSWRGAYEGWMPSTDTFRHHVAKMLPGLSRLYLAGQWVEPGGGVPTALMSGRQLVQLLCNEAGKPFVAVS